MTLTTCFKSTIIFCTARLPSFLIAKEIKNQFLRKLLPLLFTSLLIVNLVSPQFLQARQSVGLLSVDVKYPSKGLNWLGLFVQEELSMQLQLADRFSVITPDIMRRWNQRLRDSGELTSSNISLQNSESSQIKPDRLIQIT